MLEINVEEVLLNYYHTAEEIKHMKEVEHVKHAELHERLEAYIEHVVPRDMAVRQSF